MEGLAEKEKVVKVLVTPHDCSIKLRNAECSCFDFIYANRLSQMFSQRIDLLTELAIVFVEASGLGARY